MKKGLKITLLVLLVLLVAGGIFFALTPTRKLISFLAPDIDHLRVTDARINEQTATMNLLAEVKPSLLSGFVDSVEYEFSLYGTPIAKGKKTFSRAEQEGKAQVLKLPMTMNHNVTRELVRRQVREGGKVQAHLEAYSDLPLVGPREFDINQDLDLIIPALPGQELIDVKINDFGLDNMAMTMTLLIDNPNHFDFYVRRYDVKMQLKDHMFTSGKLKKDYLIKAQSKTPIDIVATSDIQKPVKTAFKTIFGDKDWPYRMVTYSVLEPKSDVVGTVAMDNVKTGSINVMQQMKKIMKTNKAQKKAEKEQKKQEKKES
ncbi:hypothetical protein EFA69_05395 [Rufibacter immobilis]|uniref:Uncharacterized protein n=1 Tax=Rufibacter immobilis TaxID=1348778 RepID=A0A3M9N3H1_9BACT|nr:hypothetical protein [Rufibacter immobilis]RNI31945.1 hypothetical protein EFA69_05395 [Rufibacter immobilis]